MYPRAKTKGSVLGCASAICVLWGILLNFLCLCFALEISVLICLTVLQGYVHIDSSVLQDPQTSRAIRCIIFIFILANKQECFDWLNISEYDECQCISKW